MNKFIVLLVAALAVVASAQVLKLTDADFDSHIGQDAVFVKFYAEWCGHCKSMAPDYEIVADTFKNVKGVKIVKVEADKEKEVANKYGVRGFPTLKFFPAGSTTPVDYEGGRTADDIINFINSKVGTNARLKKAPTAVVTLTPENFNSIVKDESKSVLVEFYAPWCGHCKSLKPVYEKAAASFEGDSQVVVAALDADMYRDVASEYGISGYPTIKFFPKNNKKGEDYNGGRAAENFVEFLNQHTDTQRSVGGGLTAEAGRDKALDALAARFVSETSARASILAEAQASSSPAAKYYALTMKRIIEKGDSYVATEKARLNRVVDTGSVASVKKLTFLKNINILSAFESN